jgi:hypothetical protein
VGVPAVLEFVGKDYLSCEAGPEASSKTPSDLFFPDNQYLDKMAPVGGGASEFEAAALARRKALSGASGPMALVKNLRVFGIACFACLGGLLYGYNQGVFSGVLTMTSFKERKFFPPSYLRRTSC